MKTKPQQLVYARLARLEQAFPGSTVWPSYLARFVRDFEKGEESPIDMMHLIIRFEKCMARPGRDQESCLSRSCEDAEFSWSNKYRMGTHCYVAVRIAPTIIEIREIK